MKHLFDNVFVSDQAPHGSVYLIAQPARPVTIVDMPGEGLESRLRREIEAVVQASSCAVLRNVKA